MAHLFTLGWLTTSLMGALYQFLPVALGQSIARDGRTVSIHGWVMYGQELA